MANGFCGEITLRIDSLNADCQKFLDQKLDGMQKGAVFGQDTQTICKEIGLC
jgi:hypothetical protein